MSRRLRRAQEEAAQAAAAPAVPSIPVQVMAPPPVQVMAQPPPIQVAPSVPTFSKDQLQMNTVWCADGSLNCEMPKDRFGFVVTGDQLINFNRGTMGSFNITHSTTGQLRIGSTQANSYVTLGANAGIPGRGVMEFGMGERKEGNAGKIGYGTFDGGASLNIVGAGTPGSARQVKVWEDLNVTRNSNLVGDFAFTGSNGWILHTPDDGRKTLYIAPRTADNRNWNWGRQTTIENNGNVTFGGNTVRVLNAGHAPNSNNYSMEVYAPPGSGPVETSLRFHQGNRYFNQIRSNPTGFSFTAGDSGNLVPIAASQVRLGQTNLTEQNVKDLLNLIKK
jgi:hypothetical protein